VHDKEILLGGIFTTLILAAAVVGFLSVRRRWLGLATLGLLTVVAAAAAATRPGGGLLAAVPSLLGGVAAVAAFQLLWRLRTARATDHLVGPADLMNATAPRPDRRRFLVGSAGVGVGALLGGLGGRWLIGTYYNARTSLAAVKIPAVADAPVTPGGVQLAVQDLPPFITANKDFYRVDTALAVPQVNADSWSLRIHGMVDNEIHLSFADLMALPLVERDITLTCVSNPIGGPYVGNARWTGALLAPLLQRAGVHPDADQILSRSVDGWTCGTPTKAVLDGRDAMLAFGMNGQPLPLVHGFPVRMLVPGIYGYASATKWVTDIELTSFEKSSAYWVKRGYKREAPIKTMSRIDTPRGLAVLPAGKVPIAGVAWAQRRGIAKVEVQIDGGEWQSASLAKQDTVDTWIQWVFMWDAKPGPHTITVRATDMDGYTQTADRVPEFPDGATGRQNLVVTVN
jgi:DMSO/TMAO reductase YedYZ molybdopterin-dependent catalytic subunit